MDANRWIPVTPRAESPIREPDLDGLDVTPETAPDESQVESAREHIRRMSGRDLASMAGCYAIVFVLLPLMFWGAA